MKRRFKSAVKHLPKTLNSSAEGVTQHQRLIDDDRFYVIQAKKVTSPDNEADPLPNDGRVVLVSKKYRTACNPSYDAPKTSEYAFFKKFKKNIGPNNSDLLHRESKLSKITQPSNCIADTTSAYNVLKCPKKDFKIPIQVEKEYQTNECQSFSPVDSVIGISKEAKLKSFSLPTAVTPVDSNLWLSPLAGPSNNSGRQYSGNRIFAAKRQKLCQRANELFPNIEKLNSERFDLVSKLLRRLFPGKEDEAFWDSQVRKGENASTSSLAYAKPDNAKTRPLSRHIEDVTAPEYRMSESDFCPSKFPGKEDEAFWDSQVRKGENASTSSLAYTKPDNAKTRPLSRHIEDVTAPEYRMSESDFCPSKFPGKEDEAFWDSQVRKGENASTSSLAYTKPDNAKTRPLSRHIEDVTAPKYRMSQSDFCPSNFFGRPKERDPPELDNFTSAFHLIDFDVETGLQYEDVDNSQISNNKITASLWDQSDSLPSLSFDHGLADRFLPDRLHSANIPVSRGAQNLFLDWDFNEEKNDPVLAIGTIRGNQLCSPIATSRHVDYQKSTEKKLDALALCSSSLFTNSEYSDVLPYFCSATFQQKLFPADVCSKDFGTILEHEEYAVARMDRLDLPFLCNSEEQDLLEDRHPENPFESSNASVPYLSHHEKNHCDSDSLLPVALDTFGWKFLSATSSPLQRGLFTYHALRLPHREDTIGLTQEEIKNSLYGLNPTEFALQSVEDALSSDIWFSCNSKVNCDKARGRSLLLDNASWVTSVEEISPDHSDEWTCS